MTVRPYISLAIFIGINIGSVGNSETIKFCLAILMVVCSMFLIAFKHNNKEN